MVTLNMLLNCVGNCVGKKICIIGVKRRLANLTRNGLADKEDAGSSIYAEVGDGEGRHLSTFSNHFNNINSKYQVPNNFMHFISYSLFID